MVGMGEVQQPLIICIGVGSYTHVTLPKKKNMENPGVRGCIKNDRDQVKGDEHEVLVRR